MNHFAKFLRASLVTTALSAMCVVGASAASLGVGTVNADALHLRAEPNTNANILTSVAKSQNVVVLEDAGNNWYKVDYQSVQGYMFGDYLTVAAQADVTIGYGLVQTPDALLNVRSGPGFDFQPVTTLSDQTVVNIIGINNGWYKISTADGITGYVSSDYMATCKDSAGSRGLGTAAPAASSLGQQVINVAAQYLGCPYVWGGNGPSSFDCSGFTRYVYSQFGYTLNRTAGSQLSNGYAVSFNDLQPGDLVFFNNGSWDGASHVGIYVGGGQFIHASTNTYAVQYSSLSGHYINTYVGARRIF